jgi:hypothetical protein
MSTMEPDEGTRPDDRADAPRWDKTEAANPADDRADAPQWDDIPQTSAEDAGLGGTDTSADS